MWNIICNVLQVQSCVFAEHILYICRNSLKSITFFFLIKKYLSMLRYETFECLCLFTIENNVLLIKNSIWISEFSVKTFVSTTTKKIFTANSFMVCNRVIRIIRIKLNKLYEWSRMRDKDCTIQNALNAIVRKKSTYVLADVITVTRTICCVSLLHLFDCTQRNEPLS